MYIYIHTLHMVLSPLWSPFLYPSSYLLLQLNSVHQGNSTKSSVMVYIYIYIYIHIHFFGGGHELGACTVLALVVCLRTVFVEAHHTDKLRCLILL